MAQVLETPLEWGVLWHVATIPEDGTVPPPPILPARPELPLPTYDPVTGNPIPPELDADQQVLQDQYVANLVEYQALNEAREAAVDTALADSSNWHSALSVLPSEELAREALKTLIATNAGNKYARDFELVNAAPRTWSTVE